MRVSYGVFLGWRCQAGFFLDNNGTERPVIWHTRKALAYEREEATLLVGVWAQYVTVTESSVRDEVQKVAMKFELINHIWSEIGSKLFYCFYVTSSATSSVLLTSVP